MLQVYPVPAFHDNYLWVFHREGDQRAFVVDPGDATPIVQALSERHLILEGILITHHHSDHTGGIAALLESRSVPVYGPDSKNIPLVTHKLRQGDRLTLCDHIECKVIEVPGHTLDHIAYFCENGDQPALFCGDTLFAGGCGRLFEGNATQMFDSLSKLANLPSATQIYCAHEYTLANLEFALAVEPDNKQLQQRLQTEQEKRRHNHPTLPSTLSLETATNPFLRSHEPTVIKAAEKYSNTDLSNPTEVLGVVRSWKDNF